VISEPQSAVTAKLANPAPVLVIDTREQVPLPFSQLATKPGTLLSGDYSIAGAEELFAVEKKSIPDLVMSCTSERERFERELHRLRGFRFKRLVIIGSETDIKCGNFRSLANPKAIIATLYCFEIRYDLPFLFFETAELAARRIEIWASWFARELRKNANSLLEGSQENNAQLAKTGRLNQFSDEKQPTATDMRLG
jgi:ERCC4-type nuclease